MGYSKLDSYALRLPSLGALTIKCPGCGLLGPRVEARPPLHAALALQCPPSFPNSRLLLLLLAASNNQPTQSLFDACHAMMPSLSPLLITTLLLLPMLGMVSATTIDINGVEETEPEDGDARTVFTSGGTYYIALNTTFLLYYSVLAGALLLALLALSGAFSSAESTSGYGQQYGYQQHYQQRAGAEEGYRNKRQAYSSGESFPKKE